MNLLSKLLIIVLVTGSLAAPAQNVGIGTTTPDPSAMLEVLSNSAGMLIPRMSTAQRLGIPTPATGLFLYDTDTNGFWFYNGGAWVSLAGGGGPGSWTPSGSNIYNNNAGNVGIGTSAPAVPLHINNASAAELLRLQSPSAYLSFFDGAGNYQGFLWKNTSNDMVLGTSCTNASGNIVLTMGCNDILRLTPSGNGTLNGSSPALDFTQNGSLAGSVFGSGNNLNINAFRFSPLSGGSPGNLLLQQNSSQFGLSLTAGNVGIGAANPTAKLEVGTGDNSYGIIQTNGTVRAGMYVGSGGGWFATQTNNPIYFCTSLLNTNFSAQMMINTNGNVGIGTLSPQYKLSVNGSMQSKEVRVETGWADYVFEKGFRLKPLKEVEQYIADNKHLPDIPAADDIQKNGLPVGEMETKMMQKIEELTLYVIKLQKEIDQLKAGKNDNK